MADLGQYDEAFEKYQRATRQATEADPKNARTFLNWGDVLKKLRRDEEAIEKYRQATEINPNFAAAFANWGNTLHKLNWAAMMKPSRNTGGPAKSTPRIG